ncbi:transmembrane protein 150A-like isoform X2 [Ascaphus truei]|uniref:transmembrane protein 150A-like isoform X2 n=1 Tax=Ascaphus truei TaxID=8439 RepID=UPI003F5A2A3B
MALSNNHICPISNWVYNQTCESEDGTCCTMDHIPLVSKCGNLPPESCFFSLICSLGSFMVMLIGLLRYAYVIERYGPSLLNTVAFALGWICAAGLTMVGNFQQLCRECLHHLAIYRYPACILEGKLKIPFKAQYLLLLSGSRQSPSLYWSRCCLSNQHAVHLPSVSLDLPHGPHPLALLDRTSPLHSNTVWPGHFGAEWGLLHPGGFCVAAHGCALRVDFYYQRSRLLWDFFI